MASARRVWPALAMLVFVALVTPFLPEAFYQRAMSILPALSKQSDTFGQRVNIWEQGVQMIKAHPIAGVGLGNFHEMLVGFARGRDLRIRIAPHSSYVGVAAEGGLVGLGLYLLLHVLALRAAIEAFHTGVRLGRPDISLLGAAVESGILVVMTWSFSGNSETMKIIWLLFALSASLQTLSRRLTAATPTAGEAG
jgi:O-antigen ligase